MDEKNLKIIESSYSIKYAKKLTEKYSYLLNNKIRLIRLLFFPRLTIEKINDSEIEDDSDLKLLAESVKDLTNAMIKNMKKKTKNLKIRVSQYGLLSNDIYKTKDYKLNALEDDDINYD